jgi:hypothetical protein
VLAFTPPSPPPPFSPSPPPLPSPPSPPPLPAPPCTVEMLRQRPAGDKSWLIACSDTTLGKVGEELDLSDTHLSYGDFKEAKFIGTGAIKLNRANLTHADLSGSEFTTDGAYGDASIAFTEADLSHADLSGSKLTADGAYGDASIAFTEADLSHADLSDSDLTASAGAYGDATIAFTEANLAHAELSDSKLTAGIVIGLSPSLFSTHLPPSPSPMPPSPPPLSEQCGCDELRNAATEGGEGLCLKKKHEEGRTVCTGISGGGVQPCPSDHRLCSAKTLRQNCTDTKKRKKCRKFLKKGKCRKRRAALRKCKKTCGLCQP